MRILHVVAYFPPDRVGGLGEVAAHLHRGLLARGHRSAVLTAGTSRGDPAVERIAASPVGFVSRLPRYAGRAGEFDLVHCHHGDAVGLVLAMKALRIRTPVLVTVHTGPRGIADSLRPYTLDGHHFDTGWEGLRNRYLISRIDRVTYWLTLRLATGATFVSREAAVRTLGAADGAKADVIYNGLPAWEDDPAQQRPEPTELLYVGTGGHRKRLLALPFVLKYVCHALPRTRLRLVGVELAREAQLRRLLDELGLLEAVVCEGALTSEQVRPFYSAAQLLVVPSAYEGLPMVVLEALQSGLPCVVTRVGGHPEAIEEGRNGFLVPRDDPRSMAERCTEILQDHALRERLARGARATAQRFRVERQVSEYLDLYRRLCER